MSRSRQAAIYTTDDFSQEEARPGIWKVRPWTGTSSAHQSSGRDKGTTGGLLTNLGVGGIVEHIRVSFATVDMPCGNDDHAG